MPPALDQPPRLSVTVLNYNYARYLPRCLDGILSQTFDDFEVIVIDDCSPEPISDAIAPYLKDPRVRLVQHQTNQGFRASLIEGTEVHSRGEFLTVISADDFVLRNDAFERQLAPLLEDDQTVLSFSSVTRFFEDGTEQVHHSLPADVILEPKETLEQLLLNKSFWVMHSGAIFRKSAYYAAGGYRKDINLPLDYAMWTQLSVQGKTAYCRVPLYGYREHIGQMSSTRFKQNAAEVSQIVQDACREADARGYSSAGLERRALQAQLGATIIYGAFTASRRAGLQKIVAAVSSAPAPMLVSRELWIGLLRVGLGATGYDVLRRTVGRLKGGEPTSL